jgi:hypothetical protein
MRPSSASKGILVMAIAGVVAVGQARHVLAAPAKNATPAVAGDVSPTIPVAPALPPAPVVDVPATSPKTITETPFSHTGHEASAVTKIIDPFTITEISIVTAGAGGLTTSTGEIIVSPPPHGRTVVKSPPPKNPIVIPPPPPLP